MRRIDWRLRICAADAPQNFLGGAVRAVRFRESARAPEVYLIILGALLVTFVLFAPEGLVGRARRLFLAEKR